MSLSNSPHPSPPQRGEGVPHPGPPSLRSACPPSLRSGLNDGVAAGTGDCTWALPIPSVGRKPAALQMRPAAGGVAVAAGVVQRRDGGVAVYAARGRRVRMVQTGGPDGTCVPERGTLVVRVAPSGQA